jgi:protein-tyrosine phosphatase
VARVPDEPAVLVVCFGNICRSPYAAARLRERLGRCGADYVQVKSAGFIGPGRPSPTEARESAAARGIDLTGHRSELIDPAVMGQTDLVIAMTRAQARRLRDEFPFSDAEVISLGDLDPAPVEREGIRDPVEQPRQVFDAVYGQIDRCVDHAVRVICDDS